MDVSSVSQSLGNLAAAQMMSGATAQAAAVAAVDPSSDGSGSSGGSGGAGAAGVAIDVLAMELRAQRSIVDLFA